MRKKFGVPGVPIDTEMSPETVGMLAMLPDSTPVIGEKEIARAVEILAEYKRGKAALENRVVQDELWWELRHWEVIRDKSTTMHSPKPTSAWLFNSITSKHADAMDNYPDPIVLPRERSDDESAKTLSSVLPVVLEHNDFEKTYDDGWWEKLKHGTAPYGVFWDPSKDNGLGDITIRGIDLLKLFWEPGVTDIQASRNLFIVELADTDLLEQQYPEHKGKLGGNVVDVKQYVYDENIDTSKKSVVVDWYYKVGAPDGRTLLHYVKFVGNQLLFASENDPNYRNRGWYDHGMYPVVMDCLYPEKGTPVGFGYVAICKDPQLYIDQLSANILESSMKATRRRYFASTSTGINKTQFLDDTQPIVDVEGDIDDRRLKEITYHPIDGVYMNVLQMKIEEMKDTSSNRDVNNGSTGGGVTAAAAIAALQEAGNKISRDMISASYRAYREICELCIELMRQFYTEVRSFRITGEMPGGYEFVDMDNSALQDVPTGIDAVGAPMFRRPVFDLKIKAQRKNPFSRMEQNERAKELYSMGFFNPERAQEALGALEMMEFEGIDKVREQVQQGETLLNVCKKLSEQIEQVLQLTQTMGGVQPPPAQTPATPQRGISAAAVEAQKPKMGYAERLAQRSSPNMDAVSDAATPV